jgi:hypothetical protein
MQLKVKLILCCNIFIFVRVLHFYDFTNIDKVLHNCIRGLFIRNVETMRFGRDCKVKSVARICCKLQLKIKLVELKISISIVMNNVPVETACATTLALYRL